MINNFSMQLIILILCFFPIAVNSIKNSLSVDYPIFSMFLKPFSIGKIVNSFSAYFIFPKFPFMSISLRVSYNSESLPFSVPFFTLIFILRWKFLPFHMFDRFLFYFKLFHSAISALKVAIYLSKILIYERIYIFIRFKNSW